MKYKFGKRSRERLGKVDPGLRGTLIDALALDIVDMAIICGYRGRSEQDRLYAMSPPRTKLLYPNSRHNAIPSLAVDVAPWINGAPSENPLHCAHLAGIIQAVGAARGLGIRWGGNWDRDGEVMTDQKFQDLWHYETKVNVG